MLWLAESQMNQLQIHRQKDEICEGTTLDFVDGEPLGLVLLLPLSKASAETIGI
jgi:hypothetical protein